MILERIRDKIRSGFKPFTLCLSDGRSILVPHSEFIAVGANVLVVITKEDRVITIEPHHIVSVEEDPGRKIG